VSETHVLVKYSGEGQGDEESRRDGKGRVSYSRSDERMRTKDRVLNRSAEIEREVSATHALVKECRRRTG
jgi:hypothetical protein